MNEKCKKGEVVLEFDKFQNIITQAYEDGFIFKTANGQNPQGKDIYKYGIISAKGRIIAKSDFDYIICKNKY